MNMMMQGPGGAPGQLPPGMMPGAPQAPKKKAYESHLRTGFIAIAILFLALVASGFMKIQGAIIAPGTVVVEGKPKVLQHLEGGVVGEIMVKDGDRVAAGDVLMRLDPTSLEANRDLLQNRLYEFLALQTRLSAERDKDNAIDWDSVFPLAERTPAMQEVIDDQTELFETRRRAYTGQIGQLRQRITQSGRQIEGLRSLIDAREKQLVLVSKELIAQRTLREQGWVGDARILQLEREEASLRGEMANYRSEIQRTQSVVSETEIEISQVDRTFIEQVVTELRQTESQLSDTREQLIQAKDQRTRIDIIAPVSGIVHEMTVTTLGGVVTPANPIMEIIPVEDRMIVEAQVSPADIDKIYVGQQTRVRLSAFNMRTTPELQGNVITTTANTVIDQVTGIPYYAIKVEIPPDQLARLNDGLTLVAGMPAEAYFQTESRSIWNYLIKPATDQFQRALREE